MEELEILAPETKEYLEAYISILEDYEIPDYWENPENVEYCFGSEGLFDDINELINYFDALVSKNSMSAKTILQDLFIALKA